MRGNHCISGHTHNIALALALALAAGCYVERAASAPSTTTAASKRDYCTLSRRQRRRLSLACSSLPLSAIERTAVAADAAAAAAAAGTLLYGSASNKQRGASLVARGEHLLDFAGLIVLSFHKIVHLNNTATASTTTTTTITATTGTTDSTNKQEEKVKEKSHFCRRGPSLCTVIVLNYNVCFGRCTGRN